MQLSINEVENIVTRDVCAKRIAVDVLDFLGEVIHPPVAFDDLSDLAVDARLRLLYDVPLSE